MMTYLRNYVQTIYTKTINIIALIYNSIVQLTFEEGDQCPHKNDQHPMKWDYYWVCGLVVLFDERTSPLFHKQHIYQSQDLCIM